MIISISSRTTGLSPSSPISLTWVMLAVLLTEVSLSWHIIFIKQDESIYFLGLL